FVSEATKSILKTDADKVLQYGPTEGYPPLIQQIIKRLAQKEGIHIKENELLITTASQQGLDLVSKIFIDPGDIVIVEMPSYLGGLDALQSYGARFIGIPTDDDGMQVDILAAKLKAMDKPQMSRIKLIYTVPDFQNPSGVTMSLNRREQLTALAEKYDLLILEDTPYRELKYEGATLPSIFSIAGRSRVMMLYTFSKVFCPGMRLGFAIAGEQIIDKLVTAKQSTDLCTSPFNQALLCEMLKGGALDEHIGKIVSVYREKREFMLDTLDKYLTPLGLTDLKWTEPRGGLFLWLTLPDYMDTEEMLSRALQKNVAYVIGSAFYHDRSVKNTMRLNFSYPSLEKISEGIKRLSELIEEEIKPSTTIRHERTTYERKELNKI
ncbi:MAG: PLP-dependent aminotransferase family protein, partial [Candidatus Stahlbacteria bacterium]|nr:PLP-dependent aminotransferase family protein [Candidatus Stahlbacteria bacterium]